MSERLGFGRGRCIAARAERNSAVSQCTKISFRDGHDAISPLRGLWRPGQARASRNLARRTFRVPAMKIVKSGGEHSHCPQTAFHWHLSKCRPVVIS